MARKRKIHPIKNAVPPTGVTSTKAREPVEPSIYKDPENRIVPITKNHPETFKKREGYRSEIKNTATNAKA